jgi:hypothetical protein
MTDTMTSQNIDLSSWDTLYIYIYIYQMHEIKSVESVLCSTALAFIVMCVYPDNVTSMHHAYSDGSHCVACSWHSPLFSSYKS